MKKIILLIIILFLILIVLILYKSIFNITDLSDFQPFINNAENVVRIKESTLKINTNLPTIDASVSFYPLASSIVEIIYDKKNYSNELNYVSTSLAYEKIINNQVDAVIVSEPSEEQKQMIENSNVNLKFVPFAREALIFYINNHNSVKSLTIEEIRKIYLGQINSWQEINGIDKNIITYQLEKNNGSQTCFETIVKDNIVDERHIEVNDMGKIIKKVALNKNSIGYAFNSFYSNVFNSSKLKLVNVNQVEPNKENIVSGKYPLMYDLYFVYDENNPNKNLKLIEEWLLSEQGQNLVKDMGFQSIN